MAQLLDSSHPSWRNLGSMWPWHAMTLKKGYRSRPFLGSIYAVFSTAIPGFWMILVARWRHDSYFMLFPYEGCSCTCGYSNAINHTCLMVGIPPIKMVMNGGCFIIAIPTWHVYKDLIVYCNAEAKGLGQLLQKTDLVMRLDTEVSEKWSCGAADEICRNVMKLAWNWR